MQTSDAAKIISLGNASRHFPLLSPDISPREAFPAKNDWEWNEQLEKDFSPGLNRVESAEELKKRRTIAKFVGTRLIAVGIAFAAIIPLRNSARGECT